MPASHALDRTAPARATNAGDVMRIGPVAAIPAVMAELGVSPESVFAGARVSLRDFANQDLRLPLETLAGLAHEAAMRAGCPHVGVLVGNRSRLASFGSIGSLMRHSARVVDALQALVLKFHIHDWGGAPVLARRHGAEAIMGYSVLRQSPTAVRYIYDAANAIIFRMLTDLCGPEFRPKAVAFAYPRPTDIDFYREFFRCRLTFGATLTGVVFDDRWLAKPLAEARPEVLRDFVELVARKEAQNETAFVRRVELALQQMLLGGTATAPAVAAMLGVSERSLRRRLDDAGESFRSLLSRRRFELAQQLLRNTGLAMAEVAAALQYEDANAFSRAFRGWAGSSPSAWRERAHGG